MTICQVHLLTLQTPGWHFIIFVRNMQNTLDKGGIVLSGSALTKRALSDAMKELMLEKPFQKINIRQICERCGMSRKSFYYHFKDKYDLVNYIFQSEFAFEAQQRRYLQGWEFLLDLMEYFYDNRRFYVNAFSVEGQNSFSESFGEFLYPVAVHYFSSVFPDDGAIDFYAVFLTDSLRVSIFRWLKEGTPLSPQEYVDRIRSFVNTGFHHASPRPLAAISCVN